ncbi:MAG: DEAD/DEAH box helicase, partial [Bacteroidales bacterium]
TKFVKAICTGKEYVMLLTGTPVVNKPKDLVSQLGIIDQLDKFGGYSNFLKFFCDAEDRWRELNVMLRKNCFYRREKTDVLKELPAKMRQAVLCKISTQKEYNDALADLKDYLARYKKATDEQIQKSLKGEIMVRIGILKNISARGKIADVVEYVSDIMNSGEKIILFTHLRDVQDMLKKFFPAAVTIFGDDDMITRQRNVDAFQKDPKVQLIICSIKAAGVGITLTASSRVAFVELPWHPADCEQCEDRAHRIGQTDSVQCTYFLGEKTIDEDIYKLISEKRTMSNQITGATDSVEESIVNGVINILSESKK